VTRAGRHDGRVPTSLADLPWPARTERLSIRPATRDDLDTLQRIRATEGVSEWITTDAANRELFLQHYEKPESLGKTLVIELDDTIVGDLMVATEDAWAQTEVADQARGVQAELGWTLDPAYSGKGYATEAVREMLRICFEDLGLRRVTADTFAGNEPSWRLMERVGMRREQHTVADSLHRTRGWCDGLMYALLAEEWRAAAAG
jgi:RimJ/RimL family protein N-acetyltransferase